MSLQVDKVSFLWYYLLMPWGETFDLDPLSDEAGQDKATIVRWLRSNRAYYDSSETDGLEATRLVVEDRQRKGLWIIPLKQPVDAAKSNLKFWESRTIGRPSPNIRLVESSKETFIEVSLAWDSTDGEDYVTQVDINGITFIPDVVKVISPLLNDVELSSVEDYRKQ